MIKITKTASVDPSDRLNLRVRVHKRLAHQACGALPARGRPQVPARGRPQVPARGRPQVLDLLQEALAEEVATLQRCRNHHYFYMLLASGLDPQAVASESHQHAAQTQAHVDLLDDRIHVLGGGAGETPARRSSLEFAAPVSSADCDAVIREDLTHERRVIDVYGMILERLSEDDPLSFRLLERIREEKTKHAALLVNLLHRRGTRNAEYRQRPG